MEEEISYKSVSDMLRQSATKFSMRSALKYRKQGKFVALSYADFYERALMATRGLKKCNVKPGEKVAILSENRVGWVIADMGILCAGGVTVAIYPTNTPEQIEYVLNHAEVRVVFVSSKVQYAKLLKIRKVTPKVELVVSFERFLGEPALPVSTFYQLSEIDHPLTESEKKELEEGIDRITSDDLLTLIYTSGTTGVPKGAMLTHRNILFDAFYTSKKTAVLSERDVHLSFLPLSHVLERTIGYYMTIMNGSLMAFADSIEKVPENMLEVKPTVSVSVPRLFEKIHSRIIANVRQMPIVKQKLFHWAIETGKQYVEAHYIAKRSSPFLTVKYGIANQLVFGKLRKRLGGNMRLFCCGGAPLDKTINEFFWIVGLPIFEGYGLTETSPAVCFNNFDQIRFGSVGTALENTEVRADTDGELLIRGPQVMAGYYKDEKATREALQDGWFRSGDLGHVDNGFVYITGRKKELIITAGGKNIAHLRIEGELQGGKYITQAVVYGDRRPFLTALLVPNFEQLIEYAKTQNLGRYDFDYLLTHESIRQLFALRIVELNSKLAPYETIKKFVLLPRDFSIEGGEVTLTQKLKRHIIYEKYKDKIEEMYADTRK